MSCSSRCRPAPAVAALAACVTAAATASADHSTEHPQNVETTAYTVPAQHHRIGLARLAYGITDQLQIGTSPTTWSLLAPNLSVAWRFLHVGPVDLRVGATFFYLSTRLLRPVLDVPIADLFVTPWELAASVHAHDDVDVSLQALMTATELWGELDDDLLLGAAALTNLQLTPTLTWRLTPTVALELRGRYLAFQLIEARARVTTDVDPFTRVTAEGAATSDIVDFPHAFQVTVSSHLSFETFNLRLGVGYGNPTFPIVNFVLPGRGLVPQLDLYWQF